MSVKHYYVNLYPYVIQEGNSTIADIRVDVWTEDEKIIYDRHFSGSAVRNPIDKPNSNAGVFIAVGRALARAGERLQKAGDGLIKNDIDTKVEKAKQADKKMKKYSESDGYYDVIPPEVTVAAIVAHKDDGDVYD